MADSQKQVVQWFPGHMAQTRRVMKENLGSVDIVFELLDARIPQSSRNPEIRALLGEKKSVVILNKADLANTESTARWIQYFSNEGLGAVALDSKNGKGTQEVLAEARKLLKEKIQRDRERGMTKPIRAMVVGIPNVGKSTLINRFAGSKKAQAENRPGVTLSKQWVPTSMGFDLLDMPGVLWPKFEDASVGEALAMTGAIKDAILDTEEIAMLLCSRLMRVAKDSFVTRYKLNTDECEELDSYDLFELVGKRRGLLMSGGAVNSERCANMLLEEFRSGKIGRITLDIPR